MSALDPWHEVMCSRHNWNCEYGPCLGCFLDRAVYEALVRLNVSINRRYMEALARLYDVHIQTVWIWHATGNDPGERARYEASS